MPPTGDREWADRFFEEQKDRWRQAVAAIDRVDSRVDDLAREVARVQVYVESSTRAQAAIDGIRQDLADVKARISGLSDGYDRLFGEHTDVRKMSQDTRENLGQLQGRVLAFAGVLAVIVTTVLNFLLKGMGKAP